MNILKRCKAESKRIKNRIEKDKNTKEAVAIRYLLEHRNKHNDELLLKITHWTETSRIKKIAPKRNQG